MYEVKIKHLLLYYIYYEQFISTTAYQLIKHIYTKPYLEVSGRSL